MQPGSCVLALSRPRKFKFRQNPRDVAHIVVIIPCRFVKDQLALVVWRVPLHEHQPVVVRPVAGGVVDIVGIYLHQTAPVPDLAQPIAAVVVGIFYIVERQGNSATLADQPPAIVVGEVHPRQHVEGVFLRQLDRQIAIIVLVAQLEQR